MISRMRYVYPLLFLLVLVVGVGCSSSARSKKSRPKMSDAVAEASKPPEEQKAVKPKKDKPSNDDDEEEEGYIVHEPHRGGVVVSGAVAEGSHEEEAPVPAGPPVLWHAGVIGGFGTIEGSTFDAFGAFGLQGGVLLGEGRGRFDFDLIFRPANLNSKSDLAAGLKNEFDVALGASFRHIISSPGNALAPYAIGGVRGGVLAWDYENAIEIVDRNGTYLVESDALGFGEVYVGLGMSIIRSPRVELGVNLTGGYRFFSEQTMEEFENDVFDNQFLAQVLFELTFGHY